MKYIVCVVAIARLYQDVTSEIASASKLINKFGIKPVGVVPARRFVPLTEIPPPQLPVRPPTTTTLSPDMRRNLKPEDCEPKGHREVFAGAKIHIFGDYYEEKYYMTVATIVFPDHIDHKHFQVTSPVPYYTLKHTIHGIGYHPTTPKNFGACEEMYIENMEQQYSEESANQSEESLEMARLPIDLGNVEVVNDYYSDLE